MDEGGAPLEPLAERPELGPGGTVRSDEGLRERKKRLMRQQLSDTATAMFLERGFDAVRVAEVAEACGVSEKTVYNYFPTKESLLLDREDAMAASIREAVAVGGSPVQNILEALAADMHGMTSWFADQPDPAASLLMIQRFSDLVESTPSLRAHQRDMMDRLVAVAAEALAERAGLSPEDPEPQIAADALIGLWRIQFRGLKQFADGRRTPAEVFELVTDGVARAARLIDSGLWSFGVFVEDTPGQAHAKAAADAADAARAQVKVALVEARNAWRSLRAAGREHDARERAERADKAATKQAQKLAQAERQIAHAERMVEQAARLRERGERLKQNRR